MVRSSDDIFSGAVESLMDESQSLSGEANQWFPIHQAFLAFIVSSFSDLASEECRKFCFLGRDYFILGRDVDLVSALNECRSIVVSRKQGEIAENTDFFDRIVWGSLLKSPDRVTDQDFLYNLSETLSGVEMAGIPEVFIVDAFNMFFYSGTYKRFDPMAPDCFEF